jgi:hypothetical protein
VAEVQPGMALQGHDTLVQKQEAEATIAEDIGAEPCLDVLVPRQAAHDGQEQCGGCSCLGLPQVPAGTLQATIEHTDSLMTSDLDQAGLPPGKPFQLLAGLSRYRAYPATDF